MANGKLLLGLDIGSSSAKVCLLKEVRGSYEVQLVDSAEFSNDPIVEGSILNGSAITDVIRDLVRTNGIKQKACAIAISGYNVIVKRVRMPEMSEEELQENLRWEVEQHIPFDYEEVVVDTVILERNQQQKKMEILLVATKKDVVRDYISIVRDAGLEVKIVDTVSFALHNLIEVFYPKETENAVVGVINVGAAMTSMTMIVNGMPSFTRDITIGGNQITEEIQKKFGITREEAEAFKTGKSQSDGVVPADVEDVTKAVVENIVGEIRRSINFFYETTGCDRVDKIFLCGGAVKSPTTRRLFEKSLDAPVELIDLKNLACGKQCNRDVLAEKGLELTVALGLALRSANE